MRKLFRERYHISPQAYRHRQRMGRAMDLMVSSESSLPQIATKTGFHHVTHFCTSFKKAFHMTPSQGLKRFRRQSQSTQGSRK
jgi:transcriptional regulator GlxA family with amidase domain